MTPVPLRIDAVLAGWSAERRAAAAAVAVPNALRVAQAARARLQLGAETVDFAAWCDSLAKLPLARDSTAEDPAP